jgi:hypothetical protein
VAVLLLVGLAVVRVLLVIVNDAGDSARLLDDDSDSYLQPARALAEDRRFDEEPGSERPEFLRTPGYPLFLAPLLDDDGDPVAAVAVQAAVSVLAVWLTYLTARRLDLSVGWATAAATIVAVEPFQTATSGLVMTESMATTGMAAVAYCSVRLVGGGYPARWAAALGGVLVVATYIRPTTLYLPFLLAAMVLVLGARHEQVRSASRRAAALLLVVTVPLTGLWVVRNHAEVDSWSFSAIESVNLYWYHAAGLIATRDGVPWDPDTRADLTRRLDPSLTAETVEPYRAGTEVPPAFEGRVGEYYGTARSEAIEILLDDPMGVARQRAHGLYSLAVSSGWTSAAGVYGVSLPGPVAALGTVVNLALLALAASGALTALRSPGRRAVHLLVLTSAAYVLVTSSGYEAIAGHRFRTVLLPVIAVYAATGIRHLSEWWAERRRAPDAIGATH